MDLRHAKNIEEKKRPDASKINAIVFPLGANGRRGHPVIWPRDLIPALAAVTGDEGGKSVIAQYPERCRPVPSEDVGAFTDIDTRSDLDAFGRIDP